MPEGNIKIHETAEDNKSNCKNQNTVLHFIWYNKFGMYQPENCFHMMLQTNSSISTTILWH